MPTVAAVDGVPEIVGGGVVAVAALTVTLKGASDAVMPAALTEMVILESTPTLAEVGVPEIAPVALLKAAQAGRFCTLKESVAPLVSVAVGLKL